MSEEFSVYLNEYANTLLEELHIHENKKSDYRLSKIQVLEKALEDRAKKLGLRPVKRGKQLRAKK